jgi:hypothetical protein
LKRGSQTAVERWLRTSDFHRIREDLYMTDGVVMFGDQVVMLPSLQKEAIKTLHGAHLSNVSADYSSFKGKNYLVMVDSYLGWPAVYHQNGKSNTLIAMLKILFITFDILEELASDGGPQFMAYDSCDFLLWYGVHHRRSSVGFPHSN